jgi:hypothetical protein
MLAKRFIGERIPQRRGCGQVEHPQSLRDMPDKRPHCKDDRLQAWCDGPPFSYAFGMDEV